MNISYSLISKVYFTSLSRLGSSELDLQETLSLDSDLFSSSSILGYSFYIHFGMILKSSFFVGKVNKTFFKGVNVVRLDELHLCLKLLLNSYVSHFQLFSKLRNPFK